MVNTKRNRTVAWTCIALSLCVLAVSMLYLDQQTTLNLSVPVFEENAVLTLPALSENRIAMPMRIDAYKVMNYYDASKSEADRSMAVSEYEGVYRPSQSVCYSYEGKVFEVTAMISGVVTDIYEDELMGRCVEVDHGSGLVITYQSLSSTSLNINDQVHQYDVIGLAGENRYYSQLGIHAQISAHLHGELVDPESLIECKLSEID